MVVPGGAEAAQALTSLGQAVEFVKDQYRHCKAILALGAGTALLEEAKLPLGGDDPALVVGRTGADARTATRAFAAALARHRNWDRATDPPAV